MGDCVLYYTFQDVTGGVAKDISGYGNDGTIYGATQVDGKFGKALSFDGVDDYVDVSINLTAIDYENSSLTITGWVYRQNGWYGLFGVPYIWMWSFGLSYVSNLQVVTRNPDGAWGKNTGVTFPQNEWHFLAAVYHEDTKLVEVYLDGNKVWSGTTPYEPGINREAFVIGRAGDRPEGWYFNGIIDAVRFYNRALSEEEIKKHYKTDLMMFRYQCAEGSGTVVADSTIHYNNGAVSGSWTSGRYGYGIKCNPDFITITDPSTAISSATSLSVCGWVKGIWQGDSDRFWYVSDINLVSGTSMYIGADPSNGKLRARFDDGINHIEGTFSDIDWLDGTWHHIAVVFDRESGEMRAYIDGRKSVDVFDITTVSGVIASATGMWFGTNPSLDAVIDDLRLYQVALSDEDILEIIYDPKDSLVVSDSIETSVVKTTPDKVSRMLDLLPHWWNRSPE